MKNEIEQFASLLKETPEAEEYFSAREAFEKNDEARDLMTRLNTLSYELSRKQHAGTLEEEETRLFEELQKRFVSNSSVARLEQAENIFFEMLRSCNAAISREIGIDFAREAAPKG